MPADGTCSGRRPHMMILLSNPETGPKQPVVTHEMK